MADYWIEELDWRDAARVEEARRMVVAAFDDPARYGEARVAAEISEPNGLHYRRFFVALVDGQVVGVAGVKAADWAGNLHILYLSAVARPFRGCGVGRALVAARLDWVLGNFERGRILVSTPKPRRFRSQGFRTVTGSRKEGRWLMLREFP